VFRVVDALLTNFHLPRSSLLLLVSAFATRAGVRAYAHAVAAGYRLQPRRRHVVGSDFDFDARPRAVVPRTRPGLREWKARVKV
jgi:hypothetical protein